MTLNSILKAGFLCIALSPAAFAINITPKGPIDLSAGKRQHSFTVRSTVDEEICDISLSRDNSEQAPNMRLITMLDGNPINLTENPLPISFDRAGEVKKIDVILPEDQPLPSERQVFRLLVVGKGQRGQKSQGVSFRVGYAVQIRTQPSQPAPQGQPATR